MQRPNWRPYAAVLDLLIEPDFSAEPYWSIAAREGFAVAAVISAAVATDAPPPRKATSSKEPMQ